MFRNLNIWGVFWTHHGADGAECSRKVASGRRVAGTIRPLVNARDLQFKCSRVLHETLLVPVLMHFSETMLWNEKGIFKTRAVQMDYFRELLSIRRVDRRVWMKGLMKAFSGGSVMWRGWRMIGSPREFI